MTQPIQEPGTQRSIATGTWNTNQIYRRPAPPSGSAPVPVEWITLGSTTNWTSNPTTLSFTFITGNYDSTTPTFDVVGGSPTIYRSGSYMHYITVVNIGFTVGAQTVARVVLTRTAGAIPFIVNYNPDIQLTRDIDGLGNSNLLTPWWQGLLLYSGSAGGLFGTPTTLQVQADRFDDGTFVSDSAPFVSLTLVRLGDAFS